jgi:two-component system, chemotaxis family, protein-glutamate methylesterase/glutaminase
MAAAGAAHIAPAGADPFRVMIVDDSAVIRGIFRRTLDADPQISVAAAASNGQIALDMMGRDSFDVIVLDIEMPVMDGMTALPRLLAADPSIKIIMASTLTQQNADVSLKALAMGAADYIPKPTARQEIHSSTGFKQELVDKIKALGAARRGTARLTTRPDAALASPAAKPAADAPIRLRRPGLKRPQVLAIGSSTGGPQALFKVFEGLRDWLEVPIVVTQHMPKMFTRILAEHISKVAGRLAVEGEEGMAVEAGRVYVAPGERHMLFRKDGARTVIHLTEDAPENFCRPAVDPMLRSLAAVCGGHVLATILTGMGQDGMTGCQAVVEAGGTVIAQDEATSVVWGMPGAAAAAGVCTAVLPIDGIASQIRTLFGRPGA